ncbi:hypothetical protein [Actinokineospora terrae]|uniref:Uncharacterized protein n=1 Tax=Actinokineospora terrae TaxID=155974 RepID=A0A1H9VHD7_9PSEU|nr:hypothetical protein [Actinokineospora terrae]SES20988.1 hypothetical protein SAMN04487818_108364 [Actinokineospora terrae]
MNQPLRRANRERGHAFPGLAILVTAGVKAVLGAVLTVTVVLGWQQLGDLGEQLDLMAPWAKVQDYAIFYPRLVGDDLQELENGGDASSVAQARDLYPVLEAAGGIFIDSANYEPGVLPPPSSPWPAAPILVNNNYLRQYPITDATGATIAVRDDEQAWVVAVPEQYKAREGELRELLRATRTGDSETTGAVQAEERITGTPAPERFATQEVRIIWTASGQDVFSFNPVVNPDRGNMITDPVVQIMTPANSLVVDRLNSITGGLDTGLKVRVDGDPAGALDRITPLLEQLELEDNLRHLVTFHEALGTQISALRGALAQITAVACGALLVVFAVNTTVVVIGSDRLRRKLAVRRLHGIGVARSYRELLLVLAGTWPVQTLLAGGVVVWLTTETVSVPGIEQNAFGQVPALLAVAATTVAVEALLLGVTASLVERRNAVRRVKEF